MLKHGLIISCFLALLQVSGWCEEAESPLDAERIEVDAKFKEQPNQVVLAVNGLCCRNCAIGIGKKVRKLDFVDTNALPKGVKIDRKNSLLTVAVKAGETIDLQSLADAVRKAGYDPVRLYQRVENGTLKVTDIPAGL